MADSKIIKGQAYILGDSLIQDIITITTDNMYNSTQVLIQDIWEDLTSSTHEYKLAGKNYFYWETKQTSMDDDDVEVTVNVTCPRPIILDPEKENPKKVEVFSYPYNPSSSKVKGEYAKYWVEAFKTAQDNAEKNSTIQRKEITFKGTTYYDDVTGQKVTYEDTVIQNTNTGDICNLLQFYL